MKSQTLRGTVVTITEDNLRDFERNPRLGQSHVGHLCQALREAWAQNAKAEKVIEAARAWLGKLESHGRGVYMDGIPGELMDALAEYDKDDPGKVE
jgi:hypothetical protein